MKTNIINTFFFFILLSFILACNNNNQNPVASSVSKTTNLAALGKAFSHRIDDTIALDAINEYQEYITKVDSTVSHQQAAFPDPGSKLVYGAKVDRVTLLEILNASNPGDSLYIMMGIKESNSSLTGDSTDLYFAIESDSLTRKSELLGLNLTLKNGWHFFDFTQPCPHACPNFY